MSGLEIRAPLEGRVLNLAVHTVGGVVSPGKELMQIVPSGEEPALDARLAPKDIDQIYTGQAVNVRLSALNQRTTPHLWGTVSVISPDIVRDEAHNTAFFTVRVVFNKGQLERLGGVQVVPGMPADVFIQTRSRSALSYLVKPLLDQIERAFREE
jgi:HlyD family secretion protein